MSQCEPRCLTPGLEQSPVSIQAGSWASWEQPWGKGLRSKTDEKLHVTWKWMMPVQEASWALGSIKRTMDMWREGILPLYFTLVRFHPECYIQLWYLQHKKDINLSCRKSRGEPSRSSMGWSTSARKIERACVVQPGKERGPRRSSF